MLSSVVAFGSPPGPGQAVESMLQAWAKPLPAADGLALLLINPDAKPHDFSACQPRTDQAPLMRQRLPKCAMRALVARA